MITSEGNAQIKELLKLQKSARERRKEKTFVVEGMKLVEEAYSVGKLKKGYVSESVLRNEEKRVKQMSGRLPFEVVSDSVFQAMAETVTPQGILGLAEMPEYSLSEILQEEKKRFLLLDDLRDPGNLGTIMRTAEGAGMSAVILSKESVDLFNPKVVRATMGSVLRVPFCYVESLPDVINRLKNENIKVYGCMMEGSVRYDEPDYSNGAGIVIGNEANGISKEVRKHLSAAVRIPMAGKLESLNDAVAAAILMYEFTRRDIFYR
ncbi:MAG: RNA methyltransferase [Lachnospiraceae bacterium]|nr:RNA methyltransferase [Lachnospiraceae bacterium]